MASDETPMPQRPNPRRGGSRHIGAESLNESIRRKYESLSGDAEKRKAWMGSDPHANPHANAGPITRALVLHRVLWHRDQALSAQDFGQTLAATASALIEGAPANIDVKHLAGWVQPSRPVALPDPELVPFFNEALRQMAQTFRLPEDGVRAIVQSQISVDELSRRMGAEVSLPAVQETIDPFFNEASGELTPLQRAAMEWLHDGLLGPGGAQQIVGVSGTDQDSKRLGIAALIREHLQERKDIEVFASGPFRRFEDIVVRVWEFLKLPKLRTALRPPLEPGDLKDIFRTLGQAARTRSAVFIFGAIPQADGPFTGANDLFLVRHLIQALKEGGARILVSSTLPLTEIPELRLLPAKDFPWPAPKLGALAALWRLPVDRGQFWKHSERALYGPTATMAAILHGMASEAERRELGGAIWELLQAERLPLDAWKGHLHVHDGMPTAIPSWGFQVLPLSAAQLAWRIYCKLDEADKGLIRYLALSEDGLRQSSLKRLCGRSDWKPNLLAERLGRLIVTRRDSGPWQGEDLPGDPQFETSIEFEPEARRIWEYALLNPDRHACLADADTSRLMRRASWQVAKLALDRATALAMVNPVVDGALPEGITRRAQAIHRILVSIDPDMIAGSRSGEFVAELAERDAIDGLSQAQSAAWLVATLYRDWFVRDLEGDSAVSPLARDETLRLSILLGFLRVGWPMYPNAMFLSDMADGTEANYLETSEQIRLITTAVASAAQVGLVLHAMRLAAQLRELVFSAGRGGKLGAINGRVKLLPSLTQFLDIERSTRISLDCMLLIGYNLDFICNTRANAVAMLASLKIENPESEPGLARRWHGAMVRLLTRVAEVEFLRDNEDAVLGCLDEVWVHLEALNKYRTADGDAEIQGSSARILIEILLSFIEEGLYPDKGIEFTLRARYLLNATLRRLVRRPADWSLTVLAEARLLMAEALLASDQCGSPSSPVRIMSGYDLAIQRVLAVGKVNVEAEMGLPTRLRADAAIVTILAEFLSRHPGDSLPEEAVEVYFDSMERLLHLTKTRSFHILRTIAVKSLARVYSRHREMTKASFRGLDQDIEELVGEAQDFCRRAALRRNLRQLESAVQLD